MCDNLQYEWMMWKKFVKGKRLIQEWLFSLPLELKENFWHGASFLWEFLARLPNSNNFDIPLYDMIRNSWIFSRKYSDIQSRIPPCPLQSPTYLLGRFSNGICKKQPKYREPYTTTSFMQTSVPFYLFLRVQTLVDCILYPKISSAAVLGPARVLATKQFQDMKQIMYTVLSYVTSPSYIL